MRFRTQIPLSLAALCWVILGLVSGVWLGPAHAQVNSTLCTPGHWLDSFDGSRLEPGPLFGELAATEALLLGEDHDDVEHHRWQLHTLAMLYGRTPELVIGFEMFPRSVQPVLDRWVAGELDRDTFLQESRWYEVWGMDPELYMPLFEFARQFRIPMIALNVERSLVSTVGRDGWQSVPVVDREGVSDPAPPSEDYQRFLASVFVGAAHHGAQQDSAVSDDDDPLAVAQTDPAFQRFVEAQTLWDRAMAEAMVEGRERHDARLVVGIMGRGHVQYGHGVAHQLKDLQLRYVNTLLPITGLAGCPGLEPGIADVVFVIDPLAAEERQRPLLGIQFEKAAGGGIQVLRVGDDSVAAAAGLQADDIITTAAGVELDGSADLLTIIARQAPGTWLPLAIRRGDDQLAVIAKFPADDKP